MYASSCRRPASFDARSETTHTLVSAIRRRGHLEHDIWVPFAALANVRGAGSARPVHVMTNLVTSCAGGFAARQAGIRLAHSGFCRRRVEARPQ